MKLSEHIGLVVDLINRHFYWGWAVYDSDMGTGIDAVLPTEAEAIAYRDANFTADAGAGLDVDRFVHVFPILRFRGPDHQSRPGRRLTVEELDALGPCQHLDAIDKIGDGGYARTWAQDFFGKAH